jgi:hypothetical protein
MDDKERLNLKKMLKEYDTEETTDKIRELKHSKKIRKDMETFARLHHTYARLYKTNFNQFKSMAQKRCSFLHDNYNNIFNKILKNYLDLSILNEFVKMLEKIENNQMDQHEASYNVGLLLKKLYIDSALREDKSKEKYRKSKKTVKTREKKITWAEYKKTLDDSENKLKI